MLNSFHDIRSYVRTSSVWTMFSILIWVIAWVPIHATATPLPTDLKIFTSASTLSDPTVQDHLSFDTTNSVSATGNATHIGSLVQTIGGTSSTTTVNDTMVTSGTNPLSGTLTDIGDGWEIHTDIAGSFSGSSAESDSFYDLFFSFENQSPTGSVQVTITLNFDNHVDSAGGEAFAMSEIQLFDGSNTELFFSDIESDTFFGNRFNSGTRSTTDFGGGLDDVGVYQNVVTLNPGDLLDFHIFHEIEGGAFVSGSSYSASMDALVSFDAINLTNPPVPTPMPEPGIWVLLATGLLGFLFGRRINPVL